MSARSDWEKVIHLALDEIAWRKGQQDIFKQLQYMFSVKYGDEAFHSLASSFNK